jgi:nitrogenase-associated protein
MVQVLFFEKPGCINNARQKKILRNAGHNVIAMDILRYEWNNHTLLNYLSVLPILQWFNLAAPNIKSGKIDPSNLTQEQALKLMIKDPVLIRRPLMKINGQYKVGFDFDEINNLIGLQEINKEDDFETCHRDNTT